jgi:outer membrane protein assembly factor BamA
MRHRQSRHRRVVGHRLVVFLAVVLSTSIAHAGRQIIPVPEIIEDPNEGTTVGFLPVVLMSNPDETVNSIIAPDIRYNDIFGIYPTFRYFGYPDPKQTYSLIAGKGTERGEDVEADYSGEDLLDGWIDFHGNGRHEQDPFERFFGFGNNTPSSNETNYTSTTNGASLGGAVHLPASFQGVVQARIREVRIGLGGVTHLPQMRNPASGFSTVKGIDGATIVGTRFGIAYDTRDRTAIPTQGFFGSGDVEVIDRGLGSSASFIKFGLESKLFTPLREDKKVIMALHGVLNYLQRGNDAPFFEKNSVGGINSLRAFGSNRFTDNDRFFLQAELRTNVYEREIFGVRAHLEVAPFVDLGKVFNSSREFPLENLHAVGGLGFRAVVVPQVVAYVDFGTAGGGPAAFTGIDYPF